MYRGSTPTFTFEIPFESPEMDKRLSLISFEQDDELVLEKTLNDCEIESNRYLLTLSQEESLLFKEGKAIAQINIITVEGKRLVTQELKFKVSRNLHDKVIEVTGDGDN